VAEQVRQGNVQAAVNRIGLAVFSSILNVLLSKEFTRTVSVVAPIGAVIPVIVNVTWVIEVILFILITFELIDKHDHDVQLRVETVNVPGIVTSKYEGTRRLDGVTVIWRLVASP
jgi:hypothetical protein